MPKWQLQYLITVTKMSKAKYEVFPKSSLIQKHTNCYKNVLSISSTYRTITGQFVSYKTRRAPFMKMWHSI